MQPLGDYLANDFPLCKFCCSPSSPQSVKRERGSREKAMSWPWACTHTPYIQKWFRNNVWKKVQIRPDLTLDNLSLWRGGGRARHKGTGWHDKGTGPKNDQSRSEGQVDGKSCWSPSLINMMRLIHYILWLTWKEASDFL